MKKILLMLVIMVEILQLSFGDAITDTLFENYVIYESKVCGLRLKTMGVSVRKPHGFAKAVPNNKITSMAVASSSLVTTNYG